jgi:nitrite reductase/ring-hydroxylating ferredoxin subunit
MSWQPTTVSAVPPAEAHPIPIVVGGRSLVLVAWRDEWYALDDRCSHAGCAFADDGAVEDGRMICDCHGSEFDIRSGAVLRPPATQPIAMYPVRVAAGVVEVDV